MKFIKTAWCLMDKEAKLITLSIITYGLGIIARMFNSNVCIIFGSLAIIFLICVFYSMLKDDIKDFIKKVKDKMDKDNLKL